MSVLLSLCRFGQSHQTFACADFVLVGFAAAEDSEDASQAGQQQHAQLIGSSTPRAVAAAAAAQVQLSVLRAELAASDAELDHVRQHLSILLQQQPLAAGAAAAAAVPAGAGRAQPLPQSELDFLREVRTS